MAGLVKADLNVSNKGIESSVRLPVQIEAVGTSFKNPVTGEPHQAAIVLNDGFIWTKGERGVGSFKLDAGRLRRDYQGSNWILYDSTGTTDRPGGSMRKPRL